MQITVLNKPSSDRPRGAPAKLGNHECFNLKMGFNCVCKWVDSYPGNNSYTCEFCGIYSASKPSCNKCEESS